jgi:uncharacterized protein
MRFGLSVMPDNCFASAAFPLFELGMVDIIEWSFDVAWAETGRPTWLDALLEDYGASGDLIGHGVSYSLLDGRDTPRQQSWLTCLREEVAAHRYQWISEHVGFLGSDAFSFTAPLPVPVCDATIELGRRRVAALVEAAGCAVGLENLATTLTLSDALDQGRFLDSVLQPTDGFVVLDLHNLWAQAVNTDLDPRQLAETYPLDRVKELHVSGGSWSQPTSAIRPVRRDTHDDVVPEEVMSLLTWAVQRCANVDAVIYERLGPTLLDPATHGPYRDDASRIRDLIA